MGCDHDSDNSTVQLVLAMAPIKDVLESFLSNHRLSNSSSSANLEDEQDCFASLVNSCRGKFSPSERYLKALIKLYISLLERDPESDALVELVLKATKSKDGFPDPDESSYLSFFIPTASLSDNSEVKLLRIRQFPYHNDVSLRLWEAGASLAEFFIANKSLIFGKKVIELGAGVGVTGFIIAGCCNAASVHLTDYTDACRQNLEHNIEINHEWLSTVGRVSQGYLEWSEFCNGAKDGSSIQEFKEADVLIAADVTYDVSVIESLVNVIHSFLAENPSRKEVIFAITRRNIKTFEIFLGHLEKLDICCDWIANGEDCERLPRIFKCKFNQSRSDIRIASLKLHSTKERLHGFY